MLEINKIHNIDALNGLKMLKSNSVNCIITSPPYYQLRDYGHENQIGLEPTLEEYIDNLLKIFIECKRVLKNDGIMFINIADTYCGTTKKTTGDEAKNSYKDYMFRTNPIGIQRKSLMAVPERLTLALLQSGLIYRNKIIWHKPNAMPSSATDRFTVDFEEIFMFTKKPNYHFKQLKETMVTQNKHDASRGISIARQRNKLIAVRGSKGVIGQVNKGIREKGKLDRGDYSSFENKYQSPGDFVRNKRTVWKIPVSQSKVNHFATFPEKLVENMIECGCSVGGVVLDPFMGSGTTGAVAKKMKRDFIGFEINPQYQKIAEERIKSEIIEYDIFDYL